MKNLRIIAIAAATSGIFSGTALADKAAITYTTDVPSACYISDVSATSVTLRPINPADGTAIAVDAPDVTMQVTCNKTGARVSISSENQGLTSSTGDTIDYHATATVEDDNDGVSLTAQYRSEDDAPATPSDAADATITDKTLTLSLTTVGDDTAHQEGTYTDVVTVTLTVS